MVTQGLVGENLLKTISFQKSLVKAHIRRQLPWPRSTALKKPIFIVGSSRSGTTILAEVLSHSPELYSFTEHPLVRRHMWSMVANLDKVDTELPELQKTLVRLSGICAPERLLEKTPGHSLLVKPMADYFTDAKFIHIIRDARDVASSMLKHEWIADELREIHPVFWFHLLPPVFQKQWPNLDLWERAILRWAVYLDAARGISSYDERYMEVRYEEMCQAPQECFDAILEFSELDSFPELEFQISTIQPKSANRWKMQSFTQRQKKFYLNVLDQFNITMSVR
ncbi:MAG: sulfotransferase [Cyanobacteria bacterium P01_F01_bin.150]